ncbi:hypothetical protein [Actinopolymorpha alba]|nr:hypothetical protein [Actinopolymorpha alba]
MSTTTQADARKDGLTTHRRLPYLEVFWIGRRGNHFDECCLHAAGPDAG